MHAAPPVRVRLGRSPGWVGFVALTCGAAAANLVAWVLGWLDVPGAMAAVAPSGVAGAGLAAWGAWRWQAPADLQWDGTLWQWAGRQGDVQVALDLGRWMLLRFVDAATRRATWVAASRSAAPGPWAGLRAALYSRRPADPSDAPPA